MSLGRLQLRQDAMLLRWQLILLSVLTVSVVVAWLTALYLRDENRRTEVAY